MSALEEFSTMPMPLAERCRVILIRPALPANLGSVARAMRNFGLRRLCLVQPEANPFDPEALATATHGEEVLRAAEIHGDLAEAAADCGLVVGTTARVGGLFRSQNVSTPRAFMPQFAEALSRTPAALVFGPERTGLTNEETVRCHHLLTIPAAVDYPVLNLAQAATVCFYELLQAAHEPTAPPAAPAEVADFASQELAYGRLEEALTAIHFLWNEKAPAQMHALRHLLGRARPSPMETDLLLGIARQMKWFADQKKSAT